MTTRATMLKPTAGLVGNLDVDETARTVTFTADSGPVFMLAFTGVEQQVIVREMDPRMRYDQSYFVGHGDISWRTRPGDVWYHDIGPRPATTLGFTLAGRELDPVTERQLPRTGASERGLGDVTPEFS